MIHIQNKIERIKELVQELNIHRNNYYNLNKPTISDSTYDNLFDELHSLELETGFALSNSPTQTVGFEVKSKLTKRHHPTPLKSLDKIKSIDELNMWKNGKEVILMLKNDGLTVEVDYDNEIFEGGYTRGNGEIGEDITHNCHTFKNIPMKINLKSKLRTSGEAIIHRNDFENINLKLSEEEKYATPRNLVAGSVRQLDSKICSERNVYFYAFNILECDESFTDSKFKNFNILYNLGFQVTPTIFVDKNTLISEQMISELKDKAQELNIPIDGIVVSFDSVKYSNSLAETNHHPLHSIAYKFFDETEESVLRDVEWNTTRSGQINPTAIFDTVKLDNTEVSRASLFNLDFIRELQISIGSRIKVSKRNMIIPYIEENLDKNNGTISIPEHCPSCGAETYIENKGTADFLVCKNKNCPAQQLDKFVNFVKRDAMNIEGLSSSTLEKFIEKGWLKYFDDIYRLDQYKSQIVRMEGFGLKSYNKLIEAIEKSKNVKLENFITALGIEGVGVSTGKLISKKFKDINEFINAKNSEFLNIDGIGDITASAILEYRMVNLDTILRLRDILNFVQDEKKETGFKDLTNLIFVITGSVNTFKNRDDFKSLVESLNGKVSGSVSNKTNYLVNNDVNSTSGKNKTAKELGVEIISEEQFNKMIGR